MHDSVSLAAPLWRTRTDPLADEAMAALLEDPASGPLGKDRYGADALSAIEAAATSGAADHRILAFWDHTRALIASTPTDAIEAGRRMGIRHAPRTFLALLASALVESFARAEGAKVLAATGRLERDAERRVYETASMVRDALLPGGLGPEGRGTLALLRVRLLHARVRAFLRERRFDDTRYGAPINQEDMLHTLLLFDRVLVRGVRDLGGALTADEDEGWSALWRHAGRLLGIEEDLLPSSVEEAEAVYRSLRQACVPDDDSRRLTAAVLETFALEPPFFLPLSALRALSRHLVGDDLADGLGLGPPSGLDEALAMATRALRAVSETGARVPLSQWAGLKLGHAFVEANRRRVLRRIGAADYAFKTA